MTRQCIGCGSPIPTNAPLNRKRCKKNCGSTTHHAARAAASARHDVEFIGVDGEGVTYCRKCDTVKGEPLQCVKCDAVDWQHDYVLLTVGDNPPLYNEDGSHLYWEDIFTYLYECFLKKPTATYVGFFLGYDFTQWVRTIPEKRAAKLLTKEGIKSRARKQSGNNRRPFPVHLANDETEFAWEIDTLGMKTFRLRPGVDPRKKKNKHRSMIICDSGPFFQKSFLNVIASHVGTLVTQDEFDTILEGKTKRSTAKFDADMIRYNALENDILSRVMSQLNGGFTDIGIRLRCDQWYGPGQAAQKWLNNIAAPTAKELNETIPEYADTAARATYYGGWFEIFRHGIIPGETYEYDINSAYPYAIAGLPCLLHGTWSRGDGIPGDLPEGSYRMLHVHVFGKNPVCGPLPHRTNKGRVLRPKQTRGWYWQHELDAAADAGLIDGCVAIEWVQYDPCKCPKPFRSIAELYKKRLQVGKNTPSGVAYKLVYNSAYGKMAQSIGKPKFGNSFYASLITSVCRTRILEAIGTHPRGTAALLMVATDGVYFDSPHPYLELDKEKLGAWDESTKNNLCLFMPGVYWDDKSRKDVKEGKAVRVKSRGISARDLSECIEAIDDQFKNLQPGDEWPSLEIPVLFNMTSATLALARNKWHTAGAVILDGVRSINATPIIKRTPEIRFEDGMLVSSPYERSEELDTTPYEERFGREMRWFQMNDTEISPDGVVNFMALLNG